MVYSCIHVSRYCETSHLHQCLFVCRGGGVVGVTETLLDT